jgi:hypothetical protein
VLTGRRSVGIVSGGVTLNRKDIKNHTGEKMAKTFSRDTINAIIDAQNGYCGVENCFERIVDCHHILHNTKAHQKLFPLFLQSPFNAIGLCRRHHQGPEKEQFKITEKQALMYEEYLRGLKPGETYTK